MRGLWQHRHFWPVTVAITTLAVTMATFPAYVSWAEQFHGQTPQDLKNAISRAPLTDETQDPTTATQALAHADFSDASDSTSRSIEDIVSDDVTLTAVLQAFDRLTASDQQLLRLLCTVPPLDYQTIAEMLGRSIGSIGPSRARCLDKLRRLLPAGIDPKAGAR